MLATSKVDYDKTKSNSKALLIFLLLFVIFLIVTGVGILYLTKTVEDNMYIEKVNQLDRPYEVEQLRKYENDVLNSYGVVNKDKGLYRIPIEEAINKVIKNYD